MKAISYQGPHKMSVSTHAKPKIKNPTDALLRVTASEYAAAAQVEPWLVDATAVIPRLDHRTIGTDREIDIYV